MTISEERWDSVEGWYRWKMLESIWCGRSCDCPGMTTDDSNTALRALVSREFVRKTESHEEGSWTVTPKGEKVFRYTVPPKEPEWPKEDPRPDEIQIMLGLSNSDGAGFPTEAWVKFNERKLRSLSDRDFVWAQMMDSGRVAWYLSKSGWKIINRIKKQQCLHKWHENSAPIPIQTCPECGEAPTLSIGRTAHVNKITSINKEEVDAGVAFVIEHGLVDHMRDIVAGVSEGRLNETDGLLSKEKLILLKKRHHADEESVHDIYNLTALGEVVLDYAMEKLKVKGVAGEPMSDIVQQARMAFRDMGKRLIRPELVEKTLGHACDDPWHQVRTEGKCPGCSAARIWNPEVGEFDCHVGVDKEMVELTLRDKEGRTVQTGIVLPRGYTVNIVDAKDGRFELIPEKKRVRFSAKRFDDILKILATGTAPTVPSTVIDDICWLTDLVGEYQCVITDSMHALEAMQQGVGFANSEKEVLDKIYEAFKEWNGGKR